MSQIQSKNIKEGFLNPGGLGSGTQHEQRLSNGVFWICFF